MIIFDGKDLEEVAPVKIEDIRVSPIKATPVEQQRVGLGQDFIRMTNGKRTITITFALQVDDKDERFRLLDAIKEWARPYEQYPLILPMYPDKHFDVMCTEYPEPSYRQWWETKLRLVFTTFENPYLTSNDEIRANCNTQFTVGGTAPPLIRIERKLSSKATNQVYACNGRSMEFSEIPTGSLVIDLNAETAQVSGASIMKYFGKTSRFIQPAVGNLLITGNGTIIYRERWK